MLDTARSMVALMSEPEDVRALPLAGERFTGTESAVVTSPFDGHEIGRVPVCGPAEVDRAVAAAKAALAGGPLPRWKRAEVLDTAARLLAERRDEFADDHRRGGGQADQDGPRRGRAGGRARSSSPPREARTLAGEMVALDALAERRGQARLHPARADRGRRRDLAVQLPAQPRRPQARPGDRRRLSRRAQAGEPDAVQRDPPGRAADRRLRPAAGVAPRGHRRRRHRRQRARRPRRHRADHVHRLAARRLGDPGAGAAQEGRARAGQQRPGDHRARQRLADGGGEDQGRRVLPRRAELHLDPAGAGPRRHRRRVRRRAGQGGVVAGRRRSDGRADRRLGADLAGRARSGQGVGRRGGRRRAPPSPTAARSTPRACSGPPCSPA